MRAFSARRPDSTGSHRLERQQLKSFPGFTPANYAGRAGGRFGTPVVSQAQQ